MRLSLQFRNFVIVGIAAAVVHYGLLIALVEGASANTVIATLAGYLGGGLVSYWLNRRFTYVSVRSHREAGWRFALVAGIGFLLTGGLMQLLNGSLGWPYLLAQIVITGIVLMWSFVANRAWTFAR
ncbi:MAG: GtrA family protein [Beijerinckiaceae bacterium]|nr:GtrA family protein [Beijerinckiaceae bacterium]